MPRKVFVQIFMEDWSLEIKTASIFLSRMATHSSKLEYDSKLSLSIYKMEEYTC